MHLVEQGKTGTTRVPSFTLCLGDCVELLSSVPSASVDAVITDPPYPEIDRDYGRLTETEWHRLMRRVVEESRRVLKPAGSAVFILQPNMERIGRMRPWLWDFMAWTAREWNQIQDVWWWNHTTLPQACSNQGQLLRPSLKACVWLGPSDCYRNQEAVLWSEAEASKAHRLAARASHKDRPSGHSVDNATAYAASQRRDGVTPFNVLPIASSAARGPAGELKHPASTPAELCRWWIRYLTRPGDLVADWFAGGATVGEEAIKEGRDYLGCEQIPAYYHLGSDRLSQAFSTRWDRAA